MQPCGRAYLSSGYEPCEVDFSTLLPGLFPVHYCARLGPMNSVLACDRLKTVFQGLQVDLSNNHPCPCKCSIVARRRQAQMRTRLQRIAHNPCKRAQFCTTAPSCGQKRLQLRTIVRNCALSFYAAFLMRSSRAVLAHVEAAHAHAARLTFSC